jgi:hypothetical protein
MQGQLARYRLAVLARSLLVVLLAGCTAEVSSAASPGRGERAAPTPPVSGFTAPPPAQAGRLLPVTAYYLRTVGRDRFLVPERHQVRLGSSVAEAATRELLAGTPLYPGSARPFPPGCHLLGFALQGSRAVVDLSREAVAGGPGAVQALVWTVTKAADVRRVQVTVEGRTAGQVDGRSLAGLWGRRASPAGLTRDEHARIAPVALVEPVPGATVAGGRLVVRGQASVARGIVSLRLRDGGGTVVAQGFSSAPVEAPARAPFSGSLAFEPPRRRQLWFLEVFEASPVDGSVRYSVELPVRVGG